LRFLPRLNSTISTQVMVLLRGADLSGVAIVSMASAAELSVVANDLTGGKTHLAASRDYSHSCAWVATLVSRPRTRDHAVSNVRG
jgi:hypothetical protein